MSTAVAMETLLQSSGNPIHKQPWGYFGCPVAEWSQVSRLLLLFGLFASLSESLICASFHKKCTNQTGLPTSHERVAVKRRNAEQGLLRSAADAILPGTFETLIPIKSFAVLTKMLITTYPFFSFNQKSSPWRQLATWEDKKRVREKRMLSRQKEKDYTGSLPGNHPKAPHSFLWVSLPPFRKIILSQTTENKIWKEPDSARAHSGGISMSWIPFFSWISKALQVPQRDQGTDKDRIPRPIRDDFFFFLFLCVSHSDHYVIASSSLHYHLE